FPSLSLNRSSISASYIEDKASKNSDFCITQHTLQKIPENPPRRLDRVGKQASAAVVVVIRAAAGIGQHLVGLLNLTEARSRIGGWVSVRVVVRGLLSVSRLDDVGTG